jgi:hypothetical protein
LREELADLDTALLEDGSESAILRRVAGVPPTETIAEVTVAAKIVTVAQTELIGSAHQEAIAIIISPTQIDAAGWPGPQQPGDPVSDNSLPQPNDIIRRLANGREYVISMVDPVYLMDGGASQLVRINMKATR